MIRPLETGHVAGTSVIRGAPARMTLGLVGLIVCGCGDPRGHAGGPSQPSNALGHESRAGSPVLARERSMKDVSSKLESLTVTVTLQPDTGARRDDSVKLRSVLLFVSPTLRIEPHAMWPDGQPMSAHARIAPQQATAVLSRLAARGFFETAEKYHSPRTAHPGSRPPEGSRGRLEDRLERAGSRRAMRIEVTTHDANWYTYYVRSYEWSPAIGKLIDAIREPLEGEATQRLARLRQQLVW